MSPFWQKWQLFELKQLLRNSMRESFTWELGFNRPDRGSTRRGEGLSARVWNGFDVNAGRAGGPPGVEGSGPCRVSQGLGRPWRIQPPHRPQPSNPIPSGLR